MTPQVAVAGIVRWWRSRPRRERKVLGTGVAVFVIGTTLSTWDWLRDERVRLANAVAISEIQVKEVQDDLSEIQQLRGETKPAQVAAKSLVAPLSNSLRAAKIDLSVSLVDGDHLRVQGSAGFDETINWLGSVQRDYKLAVVTLLATREPTKIQFDILLGGPGS